MSPSRFFFKVVQWLVTLCVWLTVSAMLIAGWFYFDLPDVDTALAATRHPSITVVSADGEVLVAKGGRHGQPVQLSDVPKSLVHAVLATEDRRFYQHFGVDILGVFRAVWANLRAGRIVQGGSTLSQQVAKNLFFKPARSFKRKIQELMLAFWLEYRFSKDQILTIYLNRVYLGAGTFGVDAASRTYFNRSVAQISTYEAALLAGLLKAPSRYNPKTSKKRAHGRTLQVLKNMVSAGYLTKLQAEAVARSRKKSLFKSWTRTGAHFTDWVLGEVNSYVSSENRDLVVITTLNARLQRKVHTILSEALIGAKKVNNAKNGALLIIDLNGAVQAMVGGKNYMVSQFNRVTQARRQPGSAFKPIVFLSGLEAGLTPESILNDSPIDINGWRPKNFDKKYRGQVTMRLALSQSLNVVAVKIAKMAGAQRIIKTAKRLGILSPLTKDLSLSLGTSEMSLMELTSAYTSFANGGYGVLPFGIRQIKSSSGNLIYNREGSGPGQIIGSQQVGQMNDMLSSVLENGTGKNARLPWPAGGKTGTSQNYRDAWFLGYTGNLAGGVWIGNDDGGPMNRVSGGGLPARIWRDVMVVAHKGRSIKNLPTFQGNEYETEPAVSVY